MDTKNKNAYIFIFSLITALINVVFFWKSIPADKNLEIFLSLFFSFSLYFMIYFIFYFGLSLIFFRIPFMIFFLFFFFHFSISPENFPEKILFLILAIVFIISILSSNFFDNFFYLESPKGFLPVLYFINILILFLLKILQKSLSEPIFFLLIAFFFIFLILIIFISKYIKFPSFFPLAGILLFLILFFFSFFYFFPFNPPPYERRGQDFLIITLEGFRNDSISKMPEIQNFKERSTYFSSFYLSSPDPVLNLEKLYIQKGKCLLDFFPERYETLSIVPEEMKNLDLLKEFKEKKYLNEKGFYSKTISNLLFLKMLKKKEYITYKKIFDFSEGCFENLNRPFFVWLHINKLNNSIPQELILEALNGKILKPDTLKDAYFQEINNLDYNLSRFLKNLEKNQWFEKTNILILGISGYEILEHKKVGAGTGYYQESINVPFIWIGPTIQKKEINLPVSLLDIYPTILKKFNLSDDYKKFEGIEFTPAFENIFPLDRIFIFSGNKLYFKGKAYIKEDKKVIINENGKIEVYDLKKDPLEEENLYLLKEENTLKFIEEVKNL